MNKVKVNILSPGRFHVCDLARELDKNGYDVKFYSFVPASETSKYGLPRHCSASVIGVVGMFLLIERKIFKKQQWARSLRILVQDYFTALYMRKCDICISMSGDFVYSLKVAKNQGAVVILERGSKHILEQRRILESIPSNKGKKPVPDINVKRELAGYEIADYISIAAQHVKDSFFKYNYPENKLFVNPYGVDLSMFKPLPGINKKYDAIMVGQWSYQKGCDMLAEAVIKADMTLLHVGALSDVPFPKDRRFTHVEPVSQTELLNYYNQAYIFVLPSRQEGLAMVQAQAIACNLPVVGTEDSGVEDLKDFVQNPEFINVVSPNTVDNIYANLVKTREQASSLSSYLYAGNGLDNITWAAYGRRYATFLENKVVKEILNGGGKFNFIMVGQWSYQKGCDLVCEALKDTEYTLLHVGSIADVPFPENPRFVHVDAVPQSDLMFFYNLSKIFLMPSRQDGFGMVYLQALACNLPIVGSVDSGAPDIREKVANPDNIYILDTYSKESLQILIEGAIENNSTKMIIKEYAGNAIDYYSWSSYGKRYSDFLQTNIINGKATN